MTPATMTHAIVPERSLAQRLDALERANKVRSARARMRSDIKAGRTSVPALLLEPPACIASMKIFDLLIATPKYGRVKVNKTLMQCRVSPSKTIGGLTRRQCDELVKHMRRIGG